MAIHRVYDDRAELSEQAEKWGTFILANMLWAIVSIPLVTLPAATAGLFAVLGKQSRGEPVELFHEFFDTMRHLWLKATLLALGGHVDWRAGRGKLPYFAPGDFPGGNTIKLRVDHPLGDVAGDSTPSNNSQCRRGLRRRLLLAANFLILIATISPHRIFQIVDR